MSVIRKFARVETDAGLGERQILVRASNAALDRADDIVAPQGCFARKDRIPVLVDHKAEIGSLVGSGEICSISDDGVMILITFLDKGVSPVADDACLKYKAGIATDVSIGFDPVEREANGKGGFLYTKWELLELSCVVVGCNPEAVTVARSAAAATKDAKTQVKVGASRNLPIDEASAWDGPAAEKSVFDHCNFDGDDPDTTLARKAFLAYDAAAPTLKGSYHLPFAKVVDGRLTAVAAGVRAAASRLPQTDIPDDVKDKARAVIEHYEGKMAEKSQPAFTVKGLYDCAELASLLCNLGWIHDRAKWEAEVEGDASKLPAMLGAILAQAGAALIAMTQEEVAELLAGHDVEIVDSDAYVAAGATPQIKAIRSAFRKAGRVLSQANQDHLDAVAKCMGKMTDCLTKAADLHDDLHDQIEAMRTHGTSIGEHVKAMSDSAKPKDEDDDADESGDDGDDPQNSDGELSADIAARKRRAALLELAR